MDATAQAPAPTQGTEAPKQSSAPPEPKKYKVKIDQEELEVDEGELVRGYQRANSANRRFEEAARLYKEAQPYLTAKQKGDLNTLLSDLPDEKKRQWAENYLGEWLQLQQMDPIQRENLDYKKKLEQYEKEKADKEAEAKTTKERQARAQVAQKVRADLDVEIAEAVKSSGIKPTPRLIARIADEMLSTHQARGETLPASEAFKRADKTLRDDVQLVLHEMPIDKMIGYLGEDTIKKILKHQTEQVRSQSPFSTPKAPNQSNAKQPKPEVMRTDDFFNKMDKKFRGRK